VYVVEGVRPLSTQLSAVVAGTVQMPVAASLLGAVRSTRYDEGERPVDGTVQVIVTELCVEPVVGAAAAVAGAATPSVLIAPEPLPACVHDAHATPARSVDATTAARAATGTLRRFIRRVPFRSEAGYVAELVVRATDSVLYWQSDDEAVPMLTR
jgi:hypothetical protein